MVRGSSPRSQPQIVEDCRSRGRTRQTQRVRGRGAVLTSERALLGRYAELSPPGCHAATVVPRLVPGPERQVAGPFASRARLGECSPCNRWCEDTVPPNRR